MSAAPDNTTSIQSNSLANSWALGFLGIASPGFRRMISPWACQHMRALAAVHFTVGVLLLGLAVALISQRFDGWATLPLVGMALHFAIGRAEIAVARSASPRT
jgi:hypothetical protein